MIQSDITVVQNDQGYNLPFTLTDASGNAISLAGATLTFAAQRSGTSALKFNNAMVIDSAIAGTCHYLVATGDFDVPGKYICQIVVTFGTGEVLTYPNIIVNVDPTLPRNY